MALAPLIEDRFLAFPRLRIPSIFDEEEFTTLSTTSGLSISEDDKHVYVEAAVPGVEPNNIEVTFEKGILLIRAQAQEEEKKEEKKRKYFRRAERSFLYRVMVPGDIDTAVEPSATCKNGIMTVVLTKTAKALPKKIAVKAEK